MRVFGTVVFGLVFTMAFVAFFLLHSFVGLPTDTEAVVGAFRRARLHEAVVGSVHGLIASGARSSGADPTYTEHVLAEVRPSIERTLDREWFYEKLGSAHAGLVGFLENGNDTSAVDLTDLKSKLRTLLLETGRAAMEQCKSGESPDVCDNQGAIQGTFERYELEVDSAIDEIPDETNMTALLSRSNANAEEAEASDTLSGARKRLSGFRSVRLVGVFILLLLLAVVALVNLRTAARVLVNVGLVLALSCTVYLVGVNISGPHIAQLAAEKIQVEESAPADRVGAVDQATVGIGSRVVVALFDAGYRRSNTLVMVILLIAVTTMAAGAEIIELRRRRTRS